MLVADWMTSPVITVGQMAKVGVAAKLMDSHRIHQLPVISKSGRVVGMLAERDIRSAKAYHQANAHPKGLEGLDAEEVMTSNPVTVAPGDSVLRAAELLRRHRFGALPAIQDDQLVGIITRHDLLNALASVVGERHDSALVQVDLGQSTASSGEIIDNLQAGHSHPIAVIQGADYKERRFLILLSRKDTAQLEAALAAVGATMCPQRSDTP